MKLFLIRHGKTVHHEENKRQTLDSPLSPLGIAQTKAVAQRLKSEKIDRVISSTLARAKETVEVIADVLDKKVEYLDIIREVDYPKELYGMARDSDIVKEYETLLFENQHDMDWKYKGQGESLREVTNRAIEFKKILERNSSHENLAVVTHGTYLRCFVTVCILGNQYRDDMFLKLFRAFYFDNTGMSLLEYDQEKRWKVKYLNEHVHIKSLEEQ